MKKMLALMLLFASLLCADTKENALAPKMNVYAMGFRCVEVEHINEHEAMFTVENCNGDQYEFFADSSDYFVGDDITCIMYGNRTANVKDDMVVNAFADRYDLLP